MEAVVTALSTAAKSTALQGFGSVLSVAGQAMSLFGGSSQEAPPPQLIDYKPLETVEGQGITNVAAPDIRGTDTSELTAQERQRKLLAQSQTQTSFAPVEEEGPKTTKTKSLLGE